MCLLYKRRLKADEEAERKRTKRRKRQRPRRREKLRCCSIGGQQSAVGRLLGSAVLAALHVHVVYISYPSFMPCMCVSVIVRGEGGQPSQKCVGAVTNTVDASL